MSTLRQQQWSSSGLLDSIATNTLLPQNQNTFGPRQLMKLLDQAAANFVVPFILGLDEGYFKRTALVPVIQSPSTALSIGFQGTNGNNVGYRLPSDAVGVKLTDISILQTAGNPVAIPLLTEWQVGSPSAFRWGGYIENGTLFLVPAQQFNGQSYIQLIYPARPLTLCDDTSAVDANTPSAAQITAVDLTSGNIAVSPAMPASFSIGADVNFVKGDPLFETSTGGPITNISGLVLTVDPALLVDSYQRPTVQPGDWVANFGYSPFLQMPAEALNLVTQKAIVLALQALKDDGWKEADSTYKEMALEAIKLFSPRVNDSPKVLTSAGRGIGSWRRYGPWVSR